MHPINSNLSWMEENDKRSFFLQIKKLSQYYSVPSAYKKFSVFLGSWIYYHREQDTI